MDLELIREIGAFVILVLMYVVVRKWFAENPR